MSPSGVLERKMSEFFILVCHNKNIHVQHIAQ